MIQKSLFSHTPSQKILKNIKSINLTNQNVSIIVIFEGFINTLKINHIL